MKRIFDAQLLGPLAAMGLVTLVVALTTDRFLDPGNLSNLALQVSIVSLIAIGATIVIFAGGIDLSSGSMVALLTSKVAAAIVSNVRLIVISIHSLGNGMVIKLAARCRLR